MKESQISTQSDDPSRPSPGTALTTLLLGLIALWSLTLVVVAVLWGSGILTAPFNSSDPGEYNSILDRLSVPLGSGLVGFSALLSLVFTAMLLTLPKLRIRAIREVGAFAMLLALITTVVFTDTLVLAYLGYTLSFQFPPVPAAVLWQGFLLLGPGLWLAVWASLESRRQRVRAESGTNAEVDDGVANDESPAESAGAVGAASASAKIAVGVAVAVPVLYASTRILWAIGIPLGLDPEFYAEGLKVGLWHSGLVLAFSGLAGALLTLGLVQKWGERLPRWTGPLAGRRVPILLATLPASIVALALFTGGMGLVQSVLLHDVDLSSNWVTIGPTLLFPLWALALGWATYAYRARRLDARAAD